MRAYAILPVLLLAAPVVITGGGARVAQGESAALTLVARSPRQWTGIAVLPDGRIFVSFPRWSDDVPVSVAELLPDGSMRPFPDAAWNRSDGPIDRRFVCVQSVVADRRGFLWVLDTGSPLAAGVIPGAARLFEFDPRNRRLIRTVAYTAPVIGRESYLNDVRLDLPRGIAYLTDSGTGAIVTTDLATGTSRRLLDDHPSVKAEPIEVVIDGTAWREPGAPPPQVHADGIALSPDRSTLYFQALTGRTLYRVGTEHLRSRVLTPAELGRRVERVGVTGPADGLECGPDGTLYLTALEEHAITRLMPDGTTRVVVRDPRLEWPDSIAVGPDGALYVTTSRINLTGGPYGIYRVRPLAR